jgi:hypothetical protein
MQVFIVMAEISYSGNEHSVWNVERVFSTRQSAVEYIQNKNRNGSDVQYDIEVEEVYA